MGSNREKKGIRRGPVAMASVTYIESLRGAPGPDVPNIVLAQGGRQEAGACKPQERETRRGPEREKAIVKERTGNRGVKRRKKAMNVTRNVRISKERDERPIPRKRAKKGKKEMS